MRFKKLIFAVINATIVCGNVFAVSPYASTIQQNIQKKSFLGPASFPTTSADASFITKMKTKRVAYLPYFNRSAFSELTIEEQDELESMLYRAEVEYQARLDECLASTDDIESCFEAAAAYDDASAEIPESIYDGLTPTDIAGTASDLYMSAALTPENIAEYNLKTHNGGCTPPERSSWWKNIIQTSGKYKNTDPAFEKFMITAFRKEGGCAQLANDPGGYTCYGCASNGLCRGVNMSNISRNKVEDLAYRKMYKAYRVDRLPDAFRGYAMWGIWGSGPKLGIRLFQAALRVPQTGTIDSATISAAQNYRGDFGEVYTKAHERFYRNIVKKNARRRAFLQGWLNSLSLLRPSGCHVVPTNPIYR